MSPDQEPSEDIQEIGFDLGKNPKIRFDTFPFENLLSRSDLTHDPKMLHRVNFYLFIVITNGSGKHTIDFIEYEFQVGTVLMVRKDQVHKFHRSKAKGFVLLFTEEFVLSYLENPESLKLVQLFNDSLGIPKIELTPKQLAGFLNLLGEIREEFQSEFDSQTPSIIRSLLQALTNKLFRYKSALQGIHQDQKYIPEFLKFHRLVERDCTRSKVVQYYADQMGITTKTLNNITRHITNKSAKTFIDQALTMQIKRLLINSSLSIKEIAYASGFNEPSNLFKFFKKNTAYTPEEFRSIHT